MAETASLNHAIGSTAATTGFGVRSGRDLLDGQSPPGRPPHIHTPRESTRPRVSLDAWIPCRRGTQVVVLRPGVEPRQVESVGVPAAADGGMVRDHRVRVPVTGVDEDRQLLILEGQHASIGELPCEGRRPLPVARVDVVIVPPGIVQEGEGFDDDRIRRRGPTRERESVLADPEPVRRAVDPREFEAVLGQHVAGDGCRVDAIHATIRT